MNEDQQESAMPIEFSVRLSLKPESVAWIDRFRKEFGLNSDDATISRILDELLCRDDSAMTDP
jgi:hypothetical protein